MIKEALTLRYGRYPAESFFTVGYRRPDGVFGYSHFRVSEIAEAASFIEQQQLDVYPTMNVYGSRPPKRGTTEEISLCGWLYVDVDPGANGASDPDTIRESLEQFTPHPTVIVYSGRGYHAYWAISPTSDTHAVENRNRWLRQQLNGDPASVDAARILRLQGTRNSRTGNLCETVYSGLESYRVEDFPEIEANYTVFSVDRVPVTDDLENRIKRDAIGTTVWERIYSEETALLSGVAVNPTTGRAQRHKNDFAIACWMCQRGYTPAEAAAVLSHPHWFSGDKGNEVGWSYVQTTVNSAWSRVQIQEMKKINIRGHDGKYSPERAASSIIDRFHPQIFVGQTYIYNDEKGKYVPGLGSAISETLRFALGDAFKMDLAHEVTAQVNAFSPTVKPEGDHSKTWINIENGLLNTETREFLPYHSPSFFIPDQLPVIYRENPPQWAIDAARSYVEGVVGEDNSVLFWEHLGHALTTDVIVPAIMFFQGPGRTGKSELLHFIDGFVGSENASHTDVTDITSDQTYFIDPLRGMRINSVYDTVAERGIKNPSRVKALVTGEELMIRKIYGAPSVGRIYAKFFLATNRPVSVSTTDSGWRRRTLILMCNHVWRPNSEGYVPFAGQRLVADPDVRSAMLHLALDGLDRLRKQNDYTDTESVAKARKDDHMDNDSTAGFLFTETIDDPDSFITGKEMQERYLRYCRLNDTPHVGSQKFRKRAEDLCAEYPDFKIEKTMGYDPVKKNSTTGWKGRRLLEPDVHRHFTVVGENGNKIITENLPMKYKEN